MPRLNPFYESLQGIDDKYRDLTQRATESKVPKYGDVEYSKREARSRLRRDLASMTPEERLAELAVPGRAEEIMALLDVKE